MHSSRTRTLALVLALSALVTTSFACASTTPAPETPAPADEAGGETGDALSSGEPGAPSYGPLCGGIAGFSCPGNGVCADDPRDDCDPANGGADCGGVCTCEPMVCGPGTSFDASPEVCACVSGATRDDVCARVRCASGTHCVSEGGSARCEPD